MLSPKRFLTTKARNRQVSDITRQKKTSEKGQFVVYSADEMRFEVPLSHLSNAFFQELLNMSKDEFGLLANGRITLSCSAIFSDYVLSLIRRHPVSNAQCHAHGSQCTAILIILPYTVVDRNIKLLI